MKKLLFCLLFLPVFASAQIADFSGIQIPPVVPIITISPNTALPTTFTNIVGTASSTQSITYSFSGMLTSIGAITLPSWAEGSIDGGSTYHTSFSGLGNGSGTLLVRTAAGTSAGSYGPTNVAFSATGGTTQNCTASATVTAAPSLSVSPTTISALNSVTLTAGAPQTITTTFANLIGSATVTAVAPVEVSVDGGSTYGTSKTFSSGSPLAVKVRESAAGTPQSVSNNLTYTGSSLSTVTVPISGTISSTVTADTILVQLWDSVGSSGLAGGGKFTNAAWNNWSPYLSVTASLTSPFLKKNDGTQTGVQMTINTLNDYSDNGTTYGNTNTMGFPAGVMAVCLYNTGNITFTVKGIPTVSNVKIDVVSAAAQGSGPYGETWTSGSTTQSGVNAFNNLTNLVQLGSLTPTAGVCTVTLTAANGFGVVNAFRIILNH